MINPCAVMMRRLDGGLYESFYFRGTSLDGQQAFWLKHNLLRKKDGKQIQLDLAIILFDRTSHKTELAHCSQILSEDQLPVDWQSFHWSSHPHSFCQIQAEHLGGGIVAQSKNARWDLQCQNQGELLLHFPHERWYHSAWPKKKLLTVSSRILFHGSIQIGTQTLHGPWLGMQGHNWGREHAYRYAYANCTDFDQADAYFDGLSAQLAIAHKRIITPRLSLGVLCLGRQWYRFNQLERALFQPVTKLDHENWQIELSNRTHRLRVQVSAPSPETCAWVALNYDHPDGNRSVVRNTKFAQINLELLDKGQKLIQSISSDRCELETLMPEDLPTMGYSTPLLMQTSDTEHLSSPHI